MTTLSTVAGRISRFVLPVGAPRRQWVSRRVRALRRRWFRLRGMLPGSLAPSFWKWLGRRPPSAANPEVQRPVGLDEAGLRTDRAADAGDSEREGPDSNSTPAISICIPVFGPEPYLTACLSAIAANTQGDYELRIVDNATGYDISDAPNLQYLKRNLENVGYAVACNEAAKGAASEILCFLNVDCEVQPGWLPPLLAAFNDPQVAMVGPRIIHPGGDLQTAGIRTWHGNGRAGGKEIRRDLPTRDVDGVTGACMMIRRDVFNALGMFDTGFYNGYDDVDLCLVVREAGYTIRYVAESLVVHHESATGPERWVKFSDNIAYMNSKWGNR
jgi:GT2 family glycosyltransferase